MMKAKFLIEMNNYNTNLEKNKANYVPLSPLSFLERIKDVYPNYEAIIYEDRKYTWIDVYKRCLKFASALRKIGVGEVILFPSWQLIHQKFLKHTIQFQ